MFYHQIIPFFIILLAVAASIKAQKLTVAGAVTGGLLAVALYKGVGFYGILLLGVFFLLGTAATSWQSKAKISSGIAQKQDSKRTMGQVIANGGVAGLVGGLAILFPQQLSIWALLIAGSFSAATADTLSSELGSVYGKHFYNILTFKRDKRGLDGVISSEGLLAGICGSAIIALIHAIVYDWSFTFVIIIAGTLGNLMDSLLGAVFERKGRISNNAVNFLNTLIGAIAALLLYLAFN